MDDPRYTACTGEPRGIEGRSRHRGRIRRTTTATARLSADHRDDDVGVDRSRQRRFDCSSDSTGCFHEMKEEEERGRGNEIEEDVEGGKEEEVEDVEGDPLCFLGLYI